MRSKYCKAKISHHPQSYSVTRNAGYRSVLKENRSQLLSDAKDFGMLPAHRVLTETVL